MNNFGSSIYSQVNDTWIVSTGKRPIKFKEVIYKISSKRTLTGNVVEDGLYIS